MSKIKRGDFMTKERSQILIRKTCLVAFDILSVIIAFFLSSIIAYNGHIELSFLRYSYYLLSGLIISSLIFFVLLRLYDSLWRYASVNELLNVIKKAQLNPLEFCEHFEENVSKPSKRAIIIINQFRKMLKKSPKVHKTLQAYFV